MHQRSLFRLLLSPSLFSAAVTLGTTLGFIGYSAWLYFNENQVLYDYIFGPYGLKTFIWQRSAEAASVKTAFLGSTFAYYLLVGFAAVIIGVTVYAILQSISLLTTSGQELMGKLQHFGNTRREIIQTLIYRLGVRLLSLVGWGIFTVYFLSTILPFVVVLNRTGMDQIHNSQLGGALACVAAGLMLMIALHLQVIFARLTFLRPRLFWGDQAIEEAEASL